MTALSRICLFDPPGAGKSRTMIEDEIEALLAILDGLDGDPDREPSLGWTRIMAIGDRNDLEFA